MSGKFDFEMISDSKLYKYAKKKYNMMKVNKFLIKHDDEYYTAAAMGEEYNASVNAVVAYTIAHLVDGVDYRLASYSSPNGRHTGYGVIFNMNVDCDIAELTPFIEQYGAWDGMDNREDAAIAERQRLADHYDLLAEHQKGNKTTVKGNARVAFIPTESKTKAIPVFSNAYKRTLDLSVPYTVSFRIIDTPIAGESADDRGVRLHTKYMDDYSANVDNELTGILKSLSDNLVAERELTTVDFGRIQTADAAGYDVDGNPVVIEFKTGKEHYEKTKSAKNQLLRYAKGMSRVANFDTISMVLIYPEDGMKVQTFTLTLGEVLEQYPLVCIEQTLKDIIDNNSQFLADLKATKSLGGLRKSELLDLLADIKAVKRAIDVAKVALKKFK